MESPNLKPLTNSNYATAMAGSTAQEVVRTRVWQSVTAVETDAELLPYLQQTFVEVAGRYHKGLTDFLDWGREKSSRCNLRRHVKVCA